MKMNTEVTPTFQHMHNAAMQALLFDLVLQLHASGKIDGRSLIARLESGQAFAQAAFQKAPNPVLPALLQSLVQLLDASEQGKKPA